MLFGRLFTHPTEYIGSLAHQPKYAYAANSLVRFERFRLQGWQTTPHASSRVLEQRRDACRPRQEITLAHPMPSQVRVPWPIDQSFPVDWGLKWTGRGSRTRGSRGATSATHLTLLLLTAAAITEHVHDSNQTPAAASRFPNHFLNHHASSLLFLSSIRKQMYMFLMFLRDKIPVIIEAK